LADRGYDSDAIAAQATAQAMQAQIPPRKNHKVQHGCDRCLYRLRHLVENVFLHLKRWRGIIAARYAKNITSFVAAVQIRCIALMGQYTVTTRSKYLRYIHLSLADATRLAPSLTEDSVIEVTREELGRGSIGEHARKQLFARVKRSAGGVSGNRGDEDRLWPIDVVVMPCAYGLRPERGQRGKRLPEKVVPLMLFARLGKDGSLMPEVASERQAILSRDLLEPNRLEVSIGSAEDADAVYAKQKDRAGSWLDLMRKGIGILEQVCGRPYEEFGIEGYERLDAGYVLVSGAAASSTQIILRLVDLLRAKGRPEVPLLEALLAQADNRDLLDAGRQLDLSLQHLGQMECRYGLSVSQREALAHHLAGQTNPSVIAVDGPPGTGKTTLLLSVIATLWVKHALAEGESPIIVAASTNNQAVTNILRAFAEVKEAEGPLSGRWLSGLRSYGLYLPAKTRKKETFDFPVHEMRGMGREAVFDAQRYEDKIALDKAREEFLARFKEAFATAGNVDLSQAVKSLHMSLRDEVSIVTRTINALKALSALIGDGDVSDAAVDRYREELGKARDRHVCDAEAIGVRLQAAQRLRANWMAHASSEPWWISLLAAVGLRSLRIRRDQMFCAEAALSHHHSLDESLIESAQRPEIDQAMQMLVGVEKSALAQAKQRIADAEQKIGQLQKALSVLETLMTGKGLSVESVQQALDVGPRYTAFKLATHYWEARYLLQLQEHFRSKDAMQDSKSPTRLLAQYRRLAKLHPCFVATLFTLPGKFIAYPSQTESVALCNEIDLLIVDEAGQVPPEIGVPSFALAKHALVVGDVDQIEPIWAIPGHIDGANALHSKLVAGEDSLQSFRESGMAASSGSLMRMAQRATPYVKYPERGRGLFLSEHRRCWPEIIRMCNVLVYGGRLQPCREDNGERKIVPSVGYVHIPGNDRSRGGSRDNPAEATAIARWLALRKGEIEAAYGNERIGRLVAVVTPFAAQSRRVKSALDGALGTGHGITVGTVHALQGAERRVVIFSPTYGLGTEPGSTFIDRNRSMLNVAISRAQDAFLVFGNMHLFQPVGQHPCAIIGRMLFGDGGNEISGVDPVLLVPGQDMGPGRLIANLEDHRSVLRDALETAQRHVVIVSPFLTKAAIDTDNIEAGIRAAVGRSVQIRIVSDPQLSDNRAAFEHCVRRLENAGARVRRATTQGVHSKMLLVDRSWLVVGSFNWLSAVRQPGRQWAPRYESSLRYDGNEAFEMISRSLQDLAEIVGVERAAG
jgi:HKD family nuclease